jgi:CRP-like cAMP-binding protein
VNEFTTVTFAPGQRIFKAGDPADHLYFIQEGVVQLLDGQGRVFGEIAKGESFGEQAIVAGGIRGASVKAKQDVVCLVIAAEALKSLLAKQAPMMTPVFEALLLQQSMHNHLRLR